MSRPHSQISVLYTTCVLSPTPCSSVSQGTQTPLRDAQAPLWGFRGQALGNVCSPYGSYSFGAATAQVPPPLGTLCCSTLSFFFF